MFVGVVGLGVVALGVAGSLVYRLRRTVSVVVVEVAGSLVYRLRWTISVVMVGIAGLLVWRLRLTISVVVRWRPVVALVRGIHAIHVVPSERRRRLSVEVPWAPSRL